MRPTDELDIKLAANRARSPRYPNIADVLARREHRRIKLAARALLTLTIVSVFATPFIGGLAGLGVIFFGAGFAVCCWCEGSRHNPGGSDADPF